MSTTRASLTSANVVWREDGSPYSVDFNDIYFVPSDGIAESDYVYLQGNNLEQRWLAGAGGFAIAEAGFGTGLNFLLALRLWRASTSASNKSRQLHYYSAENHPLSRRDLSRALQAFPDLQADAATLLANYPPLLEGFYTLQFGSIAQLHLLFGPANKVFTQLKNSDRQEFAGHGVDAWFLDGFTPGKNPTMWSTELLGSVAALSHEGTTFSTFSSAGALRRELQSQGFQVRKKTGFGRKREMLTGEFAGPHIRAKYRRSNLFPAASWYVQANRPKLQSLEPGSQHTNVAVIGAGLAGCLTAAALARRGMQVSLYDSEDRPAAGASGVPLAALYTRLSPYTSSANDFALHAYLLASQMYSNILGDSPEGLLEIQTSPDAHQYAATLAKHLNNKALVQLLNPAEASAVAGVALQHPALYFPQGRAINSAGLCQSLIEGCKYIEFRPYSAINALQPTATGWQLSEENSGQTITHVNKVVVCCGPNSKRFEQLDWLPTRVIRGQIALLPSNSDSQMLRTVLCADSYLTAAANGLHCAGSSYVLDSENLQLNSQEHAANAAAAHALLPAINAATNCSNSSLKQNAWAGSRCVSPDYLPLVGPAPNIAEFESQFAKLQHDKNAPLSISPAFWPGLYLNTAMGSRGLCFAPLCAELIASQICGELSPLPAPLRHALLPARFIVRNISRGVFASNKNCA